MFRVPCVNFGSSSLPNPKKPVELFFVSTVGESDVLVFSDFLSSSFLLNPKMLLPVLVGEFLGELPGEFLGDDDGDFFANGLRFEKNPDFS